MLVEDLVIRQFGKGIITIILLEMRRNSRISGNTFKPIRDDGRKMNFIDIF